jgi:hypothetical protein
MMPNFSEMHIGAFCTGLATLAISYAADVPRWHLIGLPLILMLVYYLIFRDKRKSSGHNGMLSRLALKFSTRRRG